MDNQAKTLAARTFSEAFANAFSNSVAKATGEPWPLEILDSLPACKGTPVHFRLRIDGSISGECFIEFYEPQVSALAATISREPAESAAEDQIESVAKVISSAMSGLTEVLSPTFGPLTIKVDHVAGLAFGGLLVIPLAASSDPLGAPVLLYFGGQLLDGLSSFLEGGQAGDIREPLVCSPNLKLVMDVELNVSLLFGQRQLPLREVLDLSSGSVIELDRMVDEPVELLLDGKVIARGEAVIIDGNYGLRVTEIPQPVASHFLN